MKGRPGRNGRELRVVSLVPSLTETLLAWGVEPVAVTRFCEQPALHAVGGTKDPDVAAIVRLAPDLVLLNDEENRREDHDALVASGIRVHVTHVESVADVDPMLVALAAALGVEPAATPTTPRNPADRPMAPSPSGQSPSSAFVPIWRRPWMTFNRATYGSSVLASVGVVNVFDDAPERYPVIELEEAAARAPGVVLLPSEPYPFAERHVADVTSVADDVRLVDGRDLFWWGSRTRAALVRLAQVLGS